MAGEEKNHSEMPATARRATSRGRTDDSAVNRRRVIRQRSCHARIKRKIHPNLIYPTTRFFSKGRSHKPPRLRLNIDGIHFPPHTPSASCEAIPNPGRFRLSCGVYENNVTWRSISFECAFFLVMGTPCLQQFTLHWELQRL